MLDIKRLYDKDFSIIKDFLINNFSSPTHWPDWNLAIKKFPERSYSVIYTLV